MPSTSPSLLDGLRQQQPHAWRDFSALYGPEVFAFARSRGLQPADAKDVVQEVFRRVLEKFPVFRREREEDTFQGWLCGIAKHTISDHFCRKYRQPFVIGGSDGQRQLAEFASPDPDRFGSAAEGDTEEADFGQVGRIRQRAIELLRGEFNDQYLEICRLRVQGTCPAEIAAQLSVNRDVVYQALHRVKKRLREYLDGVE